MCTSSSRKKNVERCKCDKSHLTQLFMLDDGCSFVSMKTGKRSTSDDKLWLVVGHVPNARFMEPDNNAKTVIMDRIGEIQREGCIGTECGRAERVSVYLYQFATRYVLTCVDATS